MIHPVEEVYPQHRIPLAFLKAHASSRLLSNTPAGDPVFRRFKNMPCNVQYYHERYDSYAASLSLVQAWTKSRQVLIRMFVQAGTQRFRNARYIILHMRCCAMRLSNYHIQIFMQTYNIKRRVSLKACMYSSNRSVLVLFLVLIRPQELCCFLMNALRLACVAV